MLCALETRFLEPAESESTKFIKGLVIEKRDKLIDIKERARGLSIQLLEYIQSYENAGESFSKKSIITDCYMSLKSMQMDLLAIDGYIGELDVAAKTKLVGVGSTTGDDKQIAVYANLLYVISKSLFRALDNNEERQTLSTMHLGKNDPVFFYQKLYERLWVVNERTYKSNLDQLQFALTESFLEDLVIKDNLHENEQYLNHAILLIEKFSKAEPDRLIKEYCSIMVDLASVLHEACSKTTLNNVNIGLKREVPQIESIKIRSISKETFGDKIKGRLKEKISKRIEKYGFIPIPEEAISYLHSRKSLFLDMFDMFELEQKIIRLGELDTKTELYLTPIESDKEKLEYIVGCDSQINKVDAILNSFLEKGENKFIGLVGPPGIGKTSTIKGLTKKYKDKGLKTILIEGGHLSFIHPLGEILKKKPDYRYLLYIDDFKPSQNPYEWPAIIKYIDGMQEQTKGMIVIFSTNEKFEPTFSSDRAFFGEPMSGIPKGAISRTYVIKYEFNIKKHLSDLVKVFCKKHDIPFKREYVKEINKKTKMHLKKVSGINCCYATQAKSKEAQEE